MGATMVMATEDQAMQRQDTNGTGEGAPGDAEAPLRVGDALKADRLRLKLKQTDVTAAIGIPQSKLAAYETGSVKYPQPQRLVALARHYGRPDAYYLDIVGWPSGAALVQLVEKHQDLLDAIEANPALEELLTLAATRSDADVQALIDTLRAHNPTS